MGKLPHLLDRQPGQVGRCDSRLTGLVDVEELEQLGAFRSYVSDLQHQAAGELMLDIQVEILDVRSAHLRIDGEEVALRTVSAINGCISIQNGSTDRAGSKGIRSQARISRAGTEYTVQGK